jgi:hypothetical protein
MLQMRLASQITLPPSASLIPRREKDFSLYQHESDYRREHLCRTSAFGVHGENS